MNGPAAIAAAFLAALIAQPAAALAVQEPPPQSAAAVASADMAGKARPTDAARLQVAQGQAASATVREGLAPAECAPGHVLLRTPAGQVHDIAVEIADTDESRARGLMFRPRLEPGHGMLFIYDFPQPVAFWMRNTLIALDMLFIDAGGRVRHVHAGAIPGDETPIEGAAAGDPAPERLMVLEIGSGEAARLGLAEGTLLASPRLGEQAAWPCR